MKKQYTNKYLDYMFEKACDKIGYQHNISILVLRTKKVGRSKVYALSTDNKFMTRHKMIDQLEELVGETNV